MTAATTRVLLVHLNVEVPATDERTPDQITDAILMCFQVGYDGAPDEIGTMTVDCPLAEEIA
jgi:hypothetical protein